MEPVEYIACHGSGNRFVMIDGAARPDLTAGADLRQIARLLCGPEGFACDGLLLVVRTAGGGYAMRMFNTDGSEAGMCGNGIRCVARLVHERYVQQEAFVLESGGRSYPVRREEPLFGSLPTYGVGIGVRLTGDDFCCDGDRFVGRPIGELDPEARFTYLNLGNPHIVARVAEIDDERLGCWGERIKGEAAARFPQGANVSMVRVDGPERIFVRTYERGVGFTESCGTAMTASATAMWLDGAVTAGRPVAVENRGGMVRCVVHPGAEGRGIVTELIGNATWEAAGRVGWSPAGNGALKLNERIETERFDAEREAYAAFVEAVRKGMR